MPRTKRRRAATQNHELDQLAWGFYTDLLHELDPLYLPRVYPAQGTHERDSWILIVRAVRLALEHYAALSVPARPETVLLTPDQVCAELGIGKSYLWMLMRRGDLASIKLGKLRRISRASLDAWLIRQLEASQQNQEVPHG